MKEIGIGRLNPFSCSFAVTDSQVEGSRVRHGEKKQFPAADKAFTPKSAEDLRLSTQPFDHTLTVISNSGGVDTAELRQDVLQYGQRLAKISAMIEAVDATSLKDADYANQGQFLFATLLDEVLKIAHLFTVKHGQTPDDIDCKLADCIGALIKKIKIHERGDLFRIHFESNVYGILNATEVLSNRWKCGLIVTLLRDTDPFELAREPDDCISFVEDVIESATHLDVTGANFVLWALLKLVEKSCELKRFNIEAGGFPSDALFRLVEAAIVRHAPK
ncbi:hypothetical protein [Paraburkholderia sediminicola]|uniref:hypothetical protein n=1 Tax=Paraburkholderia sediminicola TaxID=458836 RepID=UPI0038BB071E